MNGVRTERRKSPRPPKKTAADFVYQNAAERWITNRAKNLKANEREALRIIMGFALAATGIATISLVDLAELANFSLMTARRIVERLRDKGWIVFHSSAGIANRYDVRPAFARLAQKEHASDLLARAEAFRNAAEMLERSALATSSLTADVTAREITHTDTADAIAEREAVIAQQLRELEALRARVCELEVSKGAEESEPEIAANVTAAPSSIESPSRKIETTAREHHLPHGTPSTASTRNHGSAAAAQPRTGDAASLAAIAREVLDRREVVCLGFKSSGPSVAKFYGVQEIGIVAKAVRFFETRRGDNPQIDGRTWALNVVHACKAESLLPNNKLEANRFPVDWMFRLESLLARGREGYGIRRRWEQEQRERAEAARRANEPREATPAPAPTVTRISRAKLAELAEFSGVSPAEVLRHANGLLVLDESEAA